MNCFARTLMLTSWRPHCVLASRRRSKWPARIEKETMRDDERNIK